jgi:hypothetical protein
MILTFPRIRRRNLRSYKRIERLHDETNILGVNLKDTINGRLELVSEVYLYVTLAYRLSLC